MTRHAYTVTRCACGRYTVNGVPCPYESAVASSSGPSPEYPPRKRGDGASMPTHPPVPTAARKGYRK